MVWLHILKNALQVTVPLAPLQDEGLITDMRTALDGIIATTLARPHDIGTAGIVSTGIQPDCS